MNRYALARSIQLLGLIVAPLGIAAELNDQVSLGGSLLIGCVGFGIFLIGKNMQPTRI
jgi:hypothetical protein